MPITALAYLLILIAAAYSYHGAPSQRRLPTRYAWDIAWRAAASGFLLLASQHGGYAIPITLAAYMTFLALQPLLPLYSRSPGASSGVAPLRRTTTYCLQRRALSEAPGERLYRQPAHNKTRWLACLNSGEPRPDWIQKTAAALLLGLPLAALIWAPYLRHSPATQYSDAHGYYTYLLPISWLAILAATYLLRNGKSAWRVLLCANLIAALHYALTA